MNTEKAENEQPIEVTEETDGSVTVELPDSIQTPDQPEEQKAEGGAVDSDEDHPDDTEAVRAARRARRKAKKEYIKKTNEEKDQRLTLLQRQNQELMERLAVIEQKTHSSDLARLEKAIEEEELRQNYHAAKMREATSNSDGESFVKAQEAWYESRRKVEAMKGVKTEAAKNMTQENQAVDPRLKRLAHEWMENNPWYNPNGDDEDSQIAKVIDQRLVREGWNPATEEYWEELDNRLQKRLSNRYNNEDETPRRKPRSVITSSARESSSSNGGSGRNTFVLQPEQVRAMKDAGFWDDPEMRNRMIKRYAQEARQSRG
jgi:hypothetical protein